MQIKKFISELNSIDHEWLITTNPMEEIYSFKPFPLVGVYQSNMLYIGRLSKIPAVPNEESTYNFLCIDDVKGNYDAAELQANFCNCNFVITTTTIGFRALCDLSSEIFLAEIKYTSYINHMVIASNASKGLTYLIDEAYKILKSPIIIIDTSYKVLAMFNGIQIDTRPDLDVQRELGYLTEQTIQRMKQDKVYEKIRATKYPYYDKSIEEPFGWLNVLVYIHGIEVAQIGMIELDHPFTSYDFEFLNFFSQLVSWEMQKNDFYKNNRGIMHSVFLSELLDGKIPSKRIVNLRKEQLNWVDTPYLYVFTVFDHEVNGFDQKAQIIAYQIQHLLPYTRYVIYNSKLVLLVQQTEEDISIFNDNGPIGECLASNQLNGVVSTCFSDLSDIRKYYEQTLKIYELRQLIPEQKNIFFYLDYMFYHIGQIISEKYDLKDFYHPAIFKIINYDAENQSNFLETLREHLIHMDNPTLCASHLFIHKNTYFYRMNKIRELFHLDLSNGEERLRLHLTLEFLKMQEVTEKKKTKR
ncbi:MAG: helix-turn-helix domain-containing protein [Mobilitalea sp.]